MVQTKLRKIKENDCCCRGMGLLPGVAFGRALIVQRHQPVISAGGEQCIDIDFEIRLFHELIEEIGKEIEFIREQACREVGLDTGAIFEVQSMILEDADLIRGIEAMIRNKGIALNDALGLAISDYKEKFKGIRDPYLKEKHLDVKDVLLRIQQRCRMAEGGRAVKDEADRILVAEEILPSTVIVPGSGAFSGIVTVVGGLGAHSTALARSYGIPVVGVARSVIRKIKNGDRLAIDGRRGLVYVNIDSDKESKLKRQKADFDGYWRRLIEKAPEIALSKDKKAYEVLANCGTSEDVEKAVANGADGIGLYRSEFIFYSRGRFPTEEEQRALYSKAARQFQGRPVIVRTLDIGGDKSLPYFLLPRQLNPYLGWRSLKIAFDHPSEFKSQIRAILRAAAEENIRILFPMVTSYSDMAKCRELLEECKVELKQEGRAYGQDIQAGAMIETPSALIRLADIIEKADFISIGSNDLTQYLLAVDRNNPRVSEFYLPHHPAVLSAIEQITRICGEKKKSVSICGEMVSNPCYLMLLIGIGLERFSVAPQFVPIVKDIIRHTSFKEASELTKKLLDHRTADEVYGCVKSHVESCYPDIGQIFV